ncbi:MAG: hypothetical protein EP332_04170 [Bacteroidetes bacterium]|nr:MAG: hypothetical protein EP332_04170 [Bacteroidota bacterium]
MKKSTLFFLLLSICALAAWAGTHANMPPLERSVSLNAEDLPLGQALQEIEKKADMHFSYNPQQIDAQKTVTGKYEKRSVRWILDDIFQGKVKYKTKGDYVILQERKQPKQKENEPPRSLRISGYVLDAANAEKIADVSLFDTISFHSTNSNQHGHFEFVLHPETQHIALFVQKAGYQDTTIYLERAAFKLLLITLNPLPKSDTTAADSTMQLVPVDSGLVAQTDTAAKTDNWFDLNLKEESAKAIAKIKELLNRDIRLNSNNVKDTFTRKSQVSLIPGISTNRSMGPSIRNDYSFNILGGYTGGTNVVEVGGLFNIDKGDVNGAQIAGLFNVVESKVQGVQIGGLFNSTKGKVQGVQIAGLVNSTGGEVQGSQISGLVGSNHGLDGIQVSGLLSSSSNKANGIQISGLIGKADTLNGLQVSGLVSRADRLNGIQVGGLVNSARVVKGMQIGLLNFSDSLDGLAIGLFTFSKYGYHKLEFGMDEVFPARVSFRTGGRLFHNIFSYSRDWRGERNGLWSFGYGLGTSFKLAKWLSLDLDATAYHLDHGRVDQYWSELGQFYVGFDVHFAKKFSLAFGPTFNTYFVDRFHPNYSEQLSQLRPNYLFQNDIGSDIQNFGWFGARVALRFF